MSQSQGVAYVQPVDGGIAQRPPPLETEGLIAWVRTNLFGNLTDAFITVLLFFLLLWAAWSSFSSFVLRSNVEGVTQGEGTMARVVADLEARLDRAENMQQKAEMTASALIAEQERDLTDLARRISVLDLTTLETETRLGLTRRVLPPSIEERFTIAQSKLPLSRVIELEVLKRQLVDPRTINMPDLGALSLTQAERETLARGSTPWYRGDEAEKELFQSTLSQVLRIINQSVNSDGGRVYAAMEDVRDNLNDLLSGLLLASQSVEASSVLERPTRPALQFNSFVDGVMATPITTIPVSRLQKIRKDSLSPDQIRNLRRELAQKQIDAEQPELRGLRRTQALERAESELTDSVLFLARDMPGGYDDPLPAALLQALDDVEFWPVAQILAEPRRFLPQQNTKQEPAERAARGNLDPNSATSSDGLTTVQKVPLVTATLAQSGNLEGNYANLVLDLAKAYDAQDLHAMRDALRDLGPIMAWAQSNNGANWAVIRQNFWPRMMVGTYPTEKLWRVTLVLLGLFIAVAPLLVPACRTRPFFIFAGIYPLFLLFMLSGLAIRFYGFHGAGEGVGLFGVLYSEQGRVVQATVMLVFVIAAQIVRIRTAFGKTAGPALLVGQVLAAGYFVIMIWGTVINPAAAHKNILVDSNFVGLLTADHPLGREIDPSHVQAEIDALNTRADAAGISREEALVLRTQANELRPALNAATSALRDFQNVVAEGQGTFVILPHAPSLEWGGLLVTMVLGIVGMAASLPIGIVLAFGRQSTLPVVRWFSTGLIEITRGVPLIALLLIVTFVLPKLLPPGAEYPKLGLVLLALCLFGGVYQAEVIRGGLQSLPKGQFEAAQALGLTFWQESRLITLPQALKAVIPAIVNTFIGLFKDTTFVIVVGIVDLLTIVEHQITAENAWNTSKPEALIVVALTFFILMFSLSRYSIWLEKRLATDHK